MLNMLHLPSEFGGHGHELNGHRCPYPRHGHGRKSIAKAYLEFHNLSFYFLRDS